MTAYLDNSATTAPCEEAVSAVQKALTEGWYNPSALYRPALEVQKAMENVRQICLEATGARGQKIIFTSGGTEADNIALLGYLKTIRKPGRVLLSSVEHPAVLECAEAIRKLGHTVEEIPVDREGIIDIGKFISLLDNDVIQIGIMQVNNETGAVQPIDAISKARDQYCPAASIHVDGVQGFLKTPFDFNHSGVQTYAFSGHKIHAVKGTGGLVISSKHRILPIVFGGGQETGLRSGTENTAGIMALGAAVKKFTGDNTNDMRRLKNLLYNEIKDAIPGAEINGPDPMSVTSAPHIINISLKPVRSQTMLFALEGDGIYVSAGSACSSRKQKISPVLKAMGLSADSADCALRFSLCPYTTEQEIRYTAAKVAEHWNELKQYTRR